GGHMCRRSWIHDSRNLAAVMRREVGDHPAHFSVADQQNAHHVRTFAPKNCSCNRFIAAGTSLSRSTNVMFRLDAACDTRRSGMESSDVIARPNSVGSDRRFSPTMQTIAMSRSVLTSAKFRRLLMMSSRRRGLSTVTDTLTSDVVTTSTAVLK